MEFEHEKVFYAFNSTTDLVGAKGYFSDYIAALENSVSEADEHNCITELKDIINYKFVNESGHYYNFFYMVEPAPEKWCVLKKNNVPKIVPIQQALTILHNEEAKYAKSGIPKDTSLVYEGTQKQCDEWIKDHSPKPFISTDELIETFCRKVYNTDKAKCLDLILRSKLEPPAIWIKKRNSNWYMYQIVTYSDAFVIIAEYVNDKPIFKSVSLTELFEDYSFLDDSPCGVEDYD